MPRRDTSTADPPHRTRRQMSEQSWASSSEWHVETIYVVHCGEDRLLGVRVGGFGYHTATGQPAPRAVHSHNPSVRTSVLLLLWG